MNKEISLAVGLVILTAAASSAQGTGSSVDLYEGNGGARQTDPWALCRLPAQTQTINFKKSKECKNDEARSMSLTGDFPAGFKVTVFDSPEGKKSDDWNGSRGASSIAR